MCNKEEAEKAGTGLNSSASHLRISEMPHRYEKDLLNELFVEDEYYKSRHLVTIEVFRNWNARERSGVLLRTAATGSVNMNEVLEQGLLTFPASCENAKYT
jgi:hypothetical protein